MDSTILILILLGLLMVLAVAFSIFKNPTKIYQYLVSNKGHGDTLTRAFGAVLILSLILSQFAIAGENLWDFHVKATVRGGLEYVQDYSPQCDRGGLDDNWTSNLEIKYYAAAYDSKVYAGFGYHHGSGFICEDGESYDAIGPFIEYEVRF